MSPDDPQVKATVMSRRIETLIGLGIPARAETKIKVIEGSAFQTYNVYANNTAGDEHLMFTETVAVGKPLAELRDNLLDQKQSLQQDHQERIAVVDDFLAVVVAAIPQQPPETPSEPEGAIVPVVVEPK